MAKTILDLCGGTGAWSGPYRGAGYDVRLITLPDYDITATAISPDNDMVIFAGGTAEPLTLHLSEIYGILAAPPCTMFSLARQNAATPRDFAGAMETVNACLRVIHACLCRDDSQLMFWALENPVGYLRKFMGRPRYDFYPWWFGDQSKKHTDLWGYFNEPRKMRGAVRPTYSRKAYGSMAHPMYRTPLPGMKKSDMRAITPPGFAMAFYEANK